MEEGVEEADLTNLMTSLQSTSDTLDRLLESTANSASNNIVVTGIYEPYEQFGGEGDENFFAEAFALAKGIETKVYTLEDRMLTRKGGGRRRRSTRRRRRQRRSRT